MCHIKTAVIEHAGTESHHEEKQPINNNDDGETQSEGALQTLIPILKKRKIKRKSNGKNKKKKIEKEISLAQASRTGKVDVIKQILSREDVDINEQIIGCTALHYAAFYNHIEVVKLLVESEADVDIRNTSGVTPINWAVEKQNKDIVIYLLDKCDPSIPDNNGYTPLHKACSNGDLEIAQILLSCNTEDEIWVRIDDVTKEELYTPLHIAIMKGHFDLAKFLIENKADVGAKSKSGASPLHYAVLKTEPLFIDYLIRNHDVDVHAVDNNLRTPLHWACMYSKFEFVQLLLQNGSSLLSKDFNSLTPIELATDNQLIQFLKDYSPN